MRDAIAIGLQLVVVSVGVRPERREHRRVVILSPSPPGVAAMFHETPAPRPDRRPDRFATDGESVDAMQRPFRGLTRDSGGY